MTVSAAALLALVCVYLGFTPFTPTGHTFYKSLLWNIPWLDDYKSPFRQIEFLYRQRLLPTLARPSRSKPYFQLKQQTSFYQRPQDKCNNSEGQAE